jgi:hypothetical protein
VCLLGWSSPEALLFLRFFIPLKISSFVMGEFIFSFNSAVIVGSNTMKKTLDSNLKKKHRKEMSRRMKTLRKNDPKEYWKILNTGKSTKHPDIEFKELFNSFTIFGFSL